MKRPYDVESEKVSDSETEVLIEEVLKSTDSLVVVV
jgi:hypothetical protein